MLQLAAILRLAHALDRASAGRIQRLQLETKNGHIVLSAAGYATWTPAAEEIAGASYLLELVLRRPVLVKALRVSRNGNSRTELDAASKSGR